MSYNWNYQRINESSMNMFYRNSIGASSCLVKICEVILDKKGCNFYLLIISLSILILEERGTKINVTQ